MKDLVTVLEITEKYLKIAQSARIKNRRELTALKAEALSKQTDDKTVSRKIADLFKAKNIKKSREIILCLPRYLVTTRYLKLPSRSPAEIEKIVGLSASKYLPYPLEELIPRYYLIGQDQERYSRILLVIVHRDVINRYLKILKDSGLAAAMVLISSYGLYNWYLFQRTSLETSLPVMIIDVDSAYQDLVVVSGGKLVFTRSFSVELKPSASVSLWQEEIAEEIKRSVITYQKNNIDKSPVRIVLTGSSKAIAGLDKELSRALSLPVEVVPSVEKDSLFSFSGITGLALGKPLESLNLLPQEIRERRKARVKRKEWLKIAVLFISILFVLLSGIAKNIYDRTEYLKGLKVQLNKLSLEAESLGKIKRKLEIIKEQVNISVSGIDALYELYRIALPRITLNSFSFEENDRVVIKGQAQGLSDVFGFVTALEESKRFKGVAVKNVAKRRIRSAEIADFEIICPLSVSVGDGLAPSRY